MHKEAEVAARWWADQMRQPIVHRTGNGDPIAEENDRAINWATSQIKRPTPEQVNAFEVVLARRVEELIQKHIAEGHWSKSDPRLASGFRVISTDYGPDPVLHDALVEAEIKSSLFLPMKTVMWYGPDGVSVACGYGAGAEVIYIGADYWHYLQNAEFVARTLHKYDAFTLLGDHLKTILPKSEWEGVERCAKRWDERNGKTPLLSAVKA